MDANAEAARRPSSVRGLIRHMFGETARPVIVLALTFKLGLHMASSLLKPLGVVHRDVSPQNIS